METERCEGRCRKGRFLLGNEEGNYLRIFKIYIDRKMERTTLNDNGLHT
jgi:hypothetical protein